LEYTSGVTEAMQSHSTGIRNLNADAYKNIEVPLPPFSEQQRIADILNEVFAGLATATANAERNLESAKELFESQLAKMFFELPGKCSERRLGDIVNRLTNGYVGPIRNIYVEKGVPYLLARHVHDNRLLFDGRTFISNEFNERNKKSKLKAGDVLLVQSGHIGHSAVVRADHEGHNCHAMIVISPISEIISGDFLSFYFSSPFMKRKFEEIRSGSTVPHLTCRLVKELAIPTPEIEHQRIFVTALKNIRAESDRLASLVGAKVAALNNLKRSIVEKAFAGELTLPPSQAIKEAAE
jgi:type I restriction enzyme S subunit